MVRSYLDLTIKFHDYSSFFTAFDVASYTYLTKSWHKVINKTRIDNFF